MKLPQTAPSVFCSRGPQLIIGVPLDLNDLLVVGLQRSNAGESQHFSWSAHFQYFQNLCYLDHQEMTILEANQKVCFIGRYRDYKDRAVVKLNQLGIAELIEVGIFQHI